MLKLTILTSEEIAELQELIDGLVRYDGHSIGGTLVGGTYYEGKNIDNVLRIATILGLETPNELTTPRRNNGVSKDKEIDNDKE